MQATKAVLVACAVAIAGLILFAPTNSARATNSCSGQYGTCFSMCKQYGFGRNRADHPHPQSAETCYNHCIGWKTGCLQTGCWNGDLVKGCGLSKH